MPDNCLAYLGRRDSMAKIRGQRVDVTYVEDAGPTNDAGFIRCAAGRRG